MPKRLTATEIFRRVDALIESAAAIPLPDAGQERGRAVVKIRSRLGRALRLMRRLDKYDLTEAETKTRDRYEQAANALWPKAVRG